MLTAFKASSAVLMASWAGVLLRLQAANSKATQQRAGRIFFMVFSFVIGLWLWLIAGINSLYPPEQ